MPENGRPILSTILSIWSGGMVLTNGLFDLFEQPRGLLDAGAGLGAHVHQDLPESTDGKKFSPRNGQRPNDSMTQARNPAMKVFGRPSASNNSDR